MQQTDYRTIPDIERQLDVATNPRQPPYNDLNSFMQHTRNAVPPSFEPQSGEEQLYLQGEHELKKQAGAGVANINGDGRSDPNALYRATVGNVVNYDPRYDAARRDIFTQALGQNPEAQAKYQIEINNIDEALRRGFGDNIQAIRRGLTPEGQQTLDRFEDESKLRKLYPEQYATPETQASPSAPVSEQPFAQQKQPVAKPLGETYPDLYADVQQEIRRQSGRSSGAGDKYDAALKQQTLDTIQARLDAGLINDAQAQAALEMLAKGESMRGMTTNEAEGKIIASALGLPIEDAQGKRYVISGELQSAQDQTTQYEQKRIAAQQAEQNMQLDRTLQMNRERREQEDQKMSTEDRARKIRMEEEKKEREAKGYETSVDMLPDGTQIMRYRYPGDTEWKYSKYAPKLEEGTYETPDGWRKVFPGGDIKYYSKEGGAVMGADERIYSPKYIGKSWDEMRGTTPEEKQANYTIERNKLSNWKTAEEQMKEAGTTPFKEKPKNQDKPPIEGARRGDDGKWYVIKEDGLPYEVLER